MNDCQNRIHKAIVENPQLKSQAVTLHVCGFDMITDVVSMSVCDEQRVVERACIILVAIAKSEPGPGVAHLGERGTRQKL